MTRTECTDELQERGGRKYKNTEAKTKNTTETYKNTQRHSEGETVKKIMERRPGYKSAKIKYSLAVAKKKERAKGIEALQRKTGRTNRLTDWQTDKLMPLMPLLHVAVLSISGCLALSTTCTALQTHPLPRPAPPCQSMCRVCDIRLYKCTLRNR